jgi:hypothetical protein
MHNGRELENALKYRISVCEGRTIHTGDPLLEMGRHHSVLFVVVLAG